MGKRRTIAPSRSSVVSENFSTDLWDPAYSTVVKGLLTSAVECFAANGYHATTTRDISAGVGLSPAALYVHFPSKELVLYEIMRSGHERALAIIEDPNLHTGKSSDQRLGRAIAVYTAWHARHHVAARVCQFELSALTSEHLQEITALRRRTNDVFRSIVTDGVKDGSFEGADVNRVVRAMLSLSIDLVRWYRLDGTDSPEQLGEVYGELAMRMVRAPSTARPARKRVPAATGTTRTGRRPAAS